MEVPPTVWADIPHVVLCFMALILCEKLWKWFQGVAIKEDKPKHQVSLPELVTSLVPVTKKGKPEEENEWYVDAPDQAESTRPKILAVSLREPNKETRAGATGMQQCPDDWGTTPNQSTYKETTEPPSYALTNGRGVPIVYDGAGLSEAQQLTLENLRRRRA